MANEREIGWLAGIVDGEGHLTVARIHNKARRHPSYRPCLHITNTDMRILKRVSEIVESVTGCTPYIVKAAKGGNGYKPVHRVQVDAQYELVALLPVLRPHLVAKAEQASIALEFCKRQAIRLARRRTDEVRDLDEADYLRCRALNRKGEAVVEQTAAPVLHLVRSA